MLDDDDDILLEMSVAASKRTPKDDLDVNFSITCLMAAATIVHVDNLQYYAC